MILLFFSVFIFVVQGNEDCYRSDKTEHHSSAMSIQDLVKLNEVIHNRSNIKQIFNKINVIRPVGSDNHATVRQFIKQYLLNLKWIVEETAFTTETVIGPVNFVNVIGTQNITKSRRLVLACHYDSLKQDNFYGSIDSALPCAMMLSVAEILSPMLAKKHDLDVSLELVFFDGEEAFVKWSNTDSLYGSRHLANVWHNTKDTKQCTKLEKIDALILLDLLGALDPNFYIFSNGNHKLFESLARIESTIMQQQNLYKADHHPYFNTYTVGSTIEDDHVPFLEKGVSIVHLIPLPFPSQWHKTSDNANAIDWKTCKDLELTLSAFIVQYFHLGNMLQTLHNSDL